MYFLGELVVAALVPLDPIMADSKAAFTVLVQNFAVSMCVSTLLGKSTELLPESAGAFGFNKTKNPRFRETKIMVCCVLNHPRDFIRKDWLV